MQFVYLTCFRNMGNIYLKNMKRNRYNRASEDYIICLFEDKPVRHPRQAHHHHAQRHPGR